MNSVAGVTLQGIKAFPVEIEVETTGGLFMISVVGLPDTAVREARERVRAALRSVGIKVKGRVAVNLAPADIPKEGALLDLPMAVGIACSQAGLKVKQPSLFLGELALDGRLRAVRGAVPAAFLAKEKNLEVIEISLRAENAKYRRMFYEAGVEEFLSLVKNAEFVVTNSFHGAIFSIQFETPFYVFSREQCDSKIEELLELADIKDSLMITGEENEPAPIDFAKSKARIGELRKTSLEFLKNELDGCK